MAGILDYSTTADDNDSDPPNGAPEGMRPGKVNDVIRQIMADIAALPADAGSSLIGFLQSGTGAVATDLQTRGRLVVLTGDFGTSANEAAAGAALVPAGFWPDDNSSATFFRFGGRLFVGDGAGFTGDFAGSDNPFGFARWTSRESLFLAQSPVGRIAIAGQSKTSDGVSSPGGTPTSSDPAIGIVGVAINDYTGADNRDAWGAYFEAYRATGVTGNSATGVEIDIGDDGVDHTNTPYNPFGLSTIGLEIAAGGSLGETYAYDPAAALVIGNNGNSFKKGIVFGYNAITGSDGSTGTGVAICLALGHVIQWNGPSDITGASIYSSVDTSGENVTQKFSNNAIVFYGTGAAEILRLAHNASAVNSITVSNAATGNGPTFASTGSDTNVDLRLATKGTGVLNYVQAAGSASTPGNFSADKYAEIKMNGTVYYIPLMASIW